MVAKKPPVKRKVMQKTDKNKYHSNLAETIEAGGNLLTNIGNVKNPAFLLIFVCIVGFLLIFGYQTYSFNIGLVRIGDKFDTLNTTVGEQKLQNSEQIQQQNNVLKLLNNMSERQNNYYEFQQHKKR
jgi:hypothetical protein